MLASAAYWAQKILRNASWTTQAHIRSNKTISTGITVIRLKQINSCWFGRIHVNDSTDKLRRTVHPSNVGTWDWKLFNYFVSFEIQLVDSSIASVKNVANEPKFNIGDSWSQSRCMGVYLRVIG